jgi:hypothetical protein
MLLPNVQTHRYAQTAALSDLRGSIGSDEKALMISFWNRAVRPALERSIADPLRVLARWDTDLPPALAWPLRNDRLVVLLAATMTAVAWYLLEPIVVTYDTFAYLAAAKSIAGVEGGSFTYFRPPLLPMLLAVTGVPGHQTYVWFVLAQLVLGIAAVMLMHGCLRRISRSLGLIATGLFIATFMAFVHSKSIMTEEIYLFGWCMCINGGLTYLWSGSPWRLAEVTVALLILALSRAQGAYVIAMVLPLLALGQPRRIPAIAVALTAYLLIVFSYGKLHASMARSINDAGKPIDVTSLGISDSTGKMLFFGAYYDIYFRLGRTAVAPENGSASKRMFDELRAYYSEPGRLTATMDQRLFGRFVGRPNDLLQTMAREPDGQYWWAIWNAMDDRLGAAASDALLLRVTLEAVLAHPVSLALTYGRNFLVAFFLADSPYVWKHRSFGPEWVGPGLAKEMQASGDSSVATPLARVLDVFFPTVRFLLVIGTIIVAPFAWRSQWRMSLVFCVTLVVYNQATVSLAATPENRYTFYIVPPLLAAVTMGLQAYADRPARKP